MKYPRQVLRGMIPQALVTSYHPSTHNCPRMARSNLSCEVQSGTDAQ